MLSHEKIWQGLDRLAAAFGYSASGLAKQAGLDPTSFNKSKRFSADGKPRWPSTESISRVLTATGATMSEFLSLMDSDDDSASPFRQTPAIPLIGFAQAGADGYFDEDGYPAGDSWDEIKFPGMDPAEASDVYALEISGDSMEPLYRNGDVLMVSPSTRVRKGDRVVVRTTKGEVMAKELSKKSSTRLVLKSLNPSHKERTINTVDISWVARIMWVSQ